MGYRRVLFVGLGGSGGKTIRFLKRDFTEWLNQVGWFEQRGSGERKTALPVGVQFLNIDTPSQQDGLSARGAKLSDSEYRGLVAPGMQMEGIIRALDSGDSTGASLAGWRVSPYEDVDPTVAAGQMRAVGRSIARAYASSIRDSLSRAISAIESDAAIADMRQLYSDVGAGGRPQRGREHGSTDPSTETPITVFISSLAGGTGAGLLFDVTDIFRSLEPSWEARSVGIWFTPDAFPAKYGSGLRPNALAAISEMLNGAWWQPRPSTTKGVAIGQRDTAALQSVARLPRTIDRSGVKFNYLVGQKNVGGQKMDSDARLFEKVGGALLSWVVDPVLQDTLVFHVWGNVSQRRDSEALELPWNFGKPGDAESAGGVPIFDSLGFSRVSLGTKYLRAYSVERLGRRVVEHLFRAHTDSPWAVAAHEATGLQGPQLLDHIVQQQSPGFRDLLDVFKLLDDEQRQALRRSNAATKEGRDQIARSLAGLVESSLEPKSLHEEKSRQLEGLRRLAAGSGPQKISDWVAELMPVINEDARAEILKVVERELPAKVKEWAERATQHIPGHIEDAIGRFGLEVATGIVETASDEVLSLVLPELEQLHVDYEEYSTRREVEQSFLAALDAELDTDRKVAPEDLDVALDAAINTLGYAASDEVVRAAQEMMRRFRDGFLRPFAGEMKRAVGALGKQVHETEEWPMWSDDAMPPSHLEPPRSESTVIENQEFGGIFSRLLSQTYGDMRLLEAAEAATSDVASGAFARKEASRRDATDPVREDFEEAQVIEVRRRWVVGSDLDGDDGATTPLDIKVRCDLDDVKARTELWLTQPDLPFGKFLSLNLRTYTDGDKEQQDRVLGKLQAALGTALPLVQLYDETIGNIHGKMLDESKRVEYRITKVPFSNSSIAAEVRQLLRDRVYKDLEDDEANYEIKSIMAERSELPYIDIVSWLSTPVSPLAVKTLLDPLVESWSAANATTVLKARYWKNRKARPLGEFIPLPQEQLIAALRGWFSGRVIGLIDLGPTQSPPFRILGGTHTADPQWLDFPKAFLSDLTDATDFGALVLESLSLAIALAPQTRNASLEPFLELVKLGMMDPSDASSEVLNYTSPHPAIRDWIETGQVTLQSTTDRPVASLLDDPGNPESRRQALASFFTENRQVFESARASYLSESVARNRDVLNGPPLWPGLWTQIDAAHRMLADAVEKYVIGSSSKTSGPKRPVG